MTEDPFSDDPSKRPFGRMADEDVLNAVELDIQADGRLREQLAHEVAVRAINKPAWAKRLVPLLQGLDGHNYTWAITAMQRALGLSDQEVADKAQFTHVAGAQWLRSQCSDKKVLQALAEKLGKDMKYYVAQNRNASQETLQYLLQHGGASGRQALAVRPDLPNSLVKQLCLTKQYLDSLLRNNVNRRVAQGAAHYCIEAYPSDADLLRAMMMGATPSDMKLKYARQCLAKANPTDAEELTKLLSAALAGNRLRAKITLNPRRNTT